MVYTPGDVVGKLTGDNRNHGSKVGVDKQFCEGLDSKYFWLCRPFSLCCNCLPPHLKRKQPYTMYRL